MPTYPFNWEDFHAWKNSLDTPKGATMFDMAVQSWLKGMDFDSGGIIKLPPRYNVNMLLNNPVFRNV